MKRALLCVVLMLTLVGAGFAQQTINTRPAFYVVLNSLTKTCTVVDKAPHTDTPNITVASAPTAAGIPRRSAGSAA